MGTRQGTSMEVAVESLHNIDFISDLDSLYNFCMKKNFTIDDDKEGITLLKLEKNPWKIVYNIHISNEFQVFYMKGNYSTCTRTLGICSQAAALFEIGPDN